MKDICIAIIVFIILAILYSIPVMILWNAVIPDVIGISRINFEQALCITLLSRLLIGGIGGSKDKE